MSGKENKRTEEEMSAEDIAEMELFIKNSQGFCRKVYKKDYCDEDVSELRAEIKESNEAAKRIRSGWDTK